MSLRNAFSATHLEEAAGLALARHNTSYHYVKPVCESPRNFAGNTQDSPPGEQIHTMFGEHGFVGDSGFEPRFRLILAASDLDNHMDIGMLGQVQGIGAGDEAPYTGQPNLLYNGNVVSLQI